MPDSWQNRSNAISASSNTAVDDIREAVWRLKIQTPRDKQDRADDKWAQYPVRPGEPDCIYFIRNGLCGYGTNCRFNHPNSGQSGQFKVGGPPERAGQPDCQYFLKTGTCKFGETCKYRHPRDRHDPGSLQLNILGLPVRQEEKSCSYYMRTGSCKFGGACKFNHPQPAPLGAALPIPGNYGYDSTGSAIHSPKFPCVAGLPAWSLSTQPQLSESHMHCPPAYMPYVLTPQGLVPVQRGWSPYTGTLDFVSSAEPLQSNSQSYSSKAHYTGEPGSSQQLNMLCTSILDLPERPDEPDCQYYIKMGACKYGQACKYNHPKSRNASIMGTLGPHGFPLRPGQPLCSSFGMYGMCKYGSSCKFDHPFTGYYGYILPITLPDPLPLSPCQKGSPVICSSSSCGTKISRVQSDLMSKGEGTGPINLQKSLDTESPQSSSANQQL